MTDRTMDIKAFSKLVEHASAIRRVRRLQPIGGRGDYVAPPTYQDEEKEPTHAFETRRINNEPVTCVLLDSVQSQANRLEEALVNAIESGDLKLPHLIVDFRDIESIGDIGTISTMTAPHRIFDAIIRDSMIDNTNFLDSDIGKQVSTSTIHNALALFCHSPSTLIFGGWNSTGKMGGSGPRFQRCLVSEIVGINIANSNKPSSRMDPLQIEKVDIFKTSNTSWEVEKFEDSEKTKPSKINHGNIAPSIVELGATMDYALQTTTVTLAGLRRLSFPDTKNQIVQKRNLAAWTTLTALAIVAITEYDKKGHALRSRCDLVPESTDSDFELIHNDGKIEKIKISNNEAKKLLNDSVKFAEEYELPWDVEPKILLPQENIIDLIKKSREKRHTKND